MAHGDVVLAYMLHPDDIRDRLDEAGCPSDRIGAMAIAFDPYPATPKEREEYLEERMRLVHEPHEDGFLVLGGVEVMLLWESVVPSFIHRNWIAVVLGAQAMCERGLAAIYEMQDLPGAVDHGRRNADRAALGTLLRWAREDAITSDKTLDLVQTLCDRRKVLTHWKRPLDPGTIMRRTIDREGLDHLDSLETQEYVLSEDASLAIDAVFEFCFGNQISMLQVIRYGRRPT